MSCGNKPLPGPMLTPCHFVVLLRHNELMDMLGYGWQAAILKVKSLKIKRLLSIYTSNMLLKFGFDIQSQTEVGVRKLKQGKSEGIESCDRPIVRKHPIWVKIGGVLSRVTLKFDG